MGKESFNLAKAVCKKSPSPFQFSPSFVLPFWRIAWLPAHHCSIRNRIFYLIVSTMVWIRWGDLMESLMYLSRQDLVNLALELWAEWALTKPYSSNCFLKVKQAPEYCWILGALTKEVSKSLQTIIVHLWKKIINLPFEPWKHFKKENPS